MYKRQITGYLTYKDKWDYLLNAFSDHGWSFNGTPGGLIAFSANPSKQYSAYLDIVAHEYSCLLYTSWSAALSYPSPIWS